MPGFILLHHPVHDTITHDEMRAALDDPNAAAISVKIEPARLARAETLHANWGDLRRTQEDLVEKKLKPVLDEHADYEVAYFGLAPIPLAVHLGYLVDRFRRSRVFQRHHTDHVWRWLKDDGARAPIDVLKSGLTLDVVRSEDDVVIRVSVTARIDPADTSEVVPLSSAEIDIAVPAPKEDALETSSDLEAVAAAVKEALDRAKTHRASSRRIHLFAAVPVGLAFRLGNLVSATQHHRVQTYQYVHSAKPRYRRAILLGDTGARTRELTDEDRDSAAVIRKAWSDELGRVKTFAAEIEQRATRTPNDPWHALVGTSSGAWGAAWSKLARFHETKMAVSKVDPDAHSVEGGFLYDLRRDSWVVADDLIAAIARRLQAPDALARAGRMLFFHEALHLKSHHLTDVTASAIRRFPKIVEEVDYQADVWTMLHELAFTKRFVPRGGEDDKALFLEIVRTAIETMWAFDDRIDELDEMEIRRVNRYLIWYWQLLRIERCTSLGEIVAVLANKPFIELAGPRVFADTDRVFYELREPWAADLELAALVEHAGIVRHGRGAATDLPALISGLRRRDGDVIKRVLKGVLDQAVAG